MAVRPPHPATATGAPLHRPGYLFAEVFPASIAGFAVAWLSPEGPVAWVGFAVGDTLWFLATLIGYRAARARRYRDHERWMIISFALTFSAVTFRAWLGLMIFAQLPWLASGYGGDFDALFHNAYLVTIWLAFIPNALVAAAYVVRRRHRAVAQAVTR